MLSSTKLFALTPRPLLANAFQSVHLFTPPYRFASAWIQASRAVRTGRKGQYDVDKSLKWTGSDAQVGLHGWSASASMKRWRKTELPAVLDGFVRASEA